MCASSRAPQRPAPSDGPVESRRRAVAWRSGLPGVGASGGGLGERSSGRGGLEGAALRVEQGVGAVRGLLGLRRGLGLAHSAAAGVSRGAHGGELSRGGHGRCRLQSLVPWPAPTRSLGGACEQEPQEKAADQAADQADDHAQGEPAFGGSSKISGTHGAHASTPEPRHVRREGPPSRSQTTQVPSGRRTSLCRAQRRAGAMLLRGRRLCLREGAREAEVLGARDLFDDDIDECQRCSHRSPGVKRLIAARVAFNGARNGLWMPARGPDRFA